MTAAIHPVLGEYAKRGGVHTAAHQRPKTGGFNENVRASIDVDCEKTLAEKILGGRTSTDITHANDEDPFKHLKALAESLGGPKENRTMDLG